MTLVCQAPDCNHEFDEEPFSNAEPIAKNELPVYSVQYVPSDGLGVVTDYVCSKECMESYLAAQPEVMK